MTAPDFEKEAIAYDEQYGDLPPSDVRHPDYRPTQLIELLRRIDATGYARGVAVAAAYVEDRAHQYVPSSVVHGAMLDTAHEMRQGSATDAYEAGELDDLMKKRAVAPATSKRIP